MSVTADRSTVDAPERSATGPVVDLHLGGPGPQTATPPPVMTQSHEVTAPQTAAPKKPYLHHVDLIRATTFALVIFVHVLTTTTDEFGSQGVNATAIAFHATRNIFFALTGFVLMYQNIDRADFGAATFWRRRIKLVIVPYLIWSTVYWMVLGMWSLGRGAEIPTSLDELAGQISFGTAAYHLYFLFVMLQVYILFPLLRALVIRTRGHHAVVLGTCLGLQVIIVSLMSYWPEPASWDYAWLHLYATFVPYQLVIVAGAIAADHRELIAQHLRGRSAPLAVALVATGAFAVGAYLHRVNFNGSPVNDPQSAFELTTLPFILVAVVSMYAMALHWSTFRRAATSRFASFVAYAANRSFPVFLVHIMVLFWLQYPKTDGVPSILHHVPQPLGTALVYAATVAGSLAAVEVLRRLPGSLYLTGRPRLPFRWTI
ncbi:acyltransferase [Gordonia zhaorongruii]|uniref:acyltransferase n=1 Tax=Gordonia zhaorongruii TaxID=2597659 RepID=UPI001F378F19|nr:acyltransferase [Gordonia zhaorongruii]